MDTCANKYINTEAFIPRIQIFAANCKPPTPSQSLNFGLAIIQHARFLHSFMEATLLVCAFFSKSFVSAGKSWKGRAQTSHLNSALKNMWEVDMHMASRTIRSINPNATVCCLPSAYLEAFFWAGLARTFSSPTSEALDDFAKLW